MKYLLSDSAGSLVVMALALLGCGDDGTTPPTGSAGGAAGEGGNGGIAATGGQGGAGGEVGSGGQGGDPGVGGGSSGCLSPDVLAVIDAHAQDLFATAQLVAGHPSAAEAVSFYLAPGLPAPPATPATFASLFMPCQSATLYEPFCVRAGCSQIECTGRGAGWIVHLFLAAPPLAAGGWSFDTADVDVHWADGATGLTFTSEVDATDEGGLDWTMTSEGSMDEGAVAVTATFPQLFPDGDAVLTYSADARTATGSLEVAGVAVATVGADHSFVATGDCP